MEARSRNRGDNVNMTFVDKVSVSGATVVEATATDGSVRKVLQVADPNALTQIVGHAKYRSGSTVVLRGHARLHPSLVPSLFRGTASANERQHRMEALAGYVHTLYGGLCPCQAAGGAPSCVPNWPCQGRSGAEKTGLLKGTHMVAIEPLLQHYGVKTRWIDVVDNVWVALWFGCHELQTKGRYGHHARRNPETAASPWPHVTLIDVGQQAATAVPGVQRNKSARLIDLRLAAPSLYVRPHAQHALLAASGDWSPGNDPDLSGFEMATVQIPLREALAWLGNGVSLTPYVLFPPADRDEGFRRFLEYSASPPAILGDFVHYGPGW